MNEKLKIVKNHLNSATVCLNVNNITSFNLLLLQSFVNGGVKLQLLCSFGSFKTDDNMADGSTMTCTK